jgi:hypothetical protein
MPRPRLIPEDLYPEILARSGKRESSDSIAVWVSEKIGKNVNGRTVRLMLAQVRKERAPLAKQIVTEELSKTLTADLQAVEDLLADIKKHQVRAEKVEDLIAEAERIGKADPLKIMGPNGTILALDKIEENTRRAIASVKVFEEFEGQGDARVKTGETVEVKFWPKAPALELAANLRSGIKALVSIAKRLEVLAFRLKLSGAGGGGEDDGGGVVVLPAEGD